MHIQRRVQGRGTTRDLPDVGGVGVAYVGARRGLVVKNAKCPYFGTSLNDLTAAIVCPGVAETESR